VKPQLSIIIPTHKRASILKQCLEHLEKQTIVDQLEVIVVSDGPDAETDAIFKNTQYLILNTQYFSIPKSHQGVARNRGVERASAPIILFAQDDIFLAPDACKKHLQIHTQYPILNTQYCAALGHTTWDPACNITPVMEWLERSGWQFGYPMIAQYADKALPKNIQHRFTYTSHISLPTAIAKKYPFREDVTLYGWEDILWGTQLCDAGVKLIYEPGAKALHHHHVDMEDSLKRMETIGQSLQKMQEIDPTFDRIPKGWKLAAHQMMALMPTMRGKHEKAFMRGLRT